MYTVSSMEGVIGNRRWSDFNASPVGERFRMQWVWYKKYPMCLGLRECSVIKLAYFGRSEKHAYCEIWSHKVSSKILPRIFVLWGLNNICSEDHLWRTCGKERGQTCTVSDPAVRDLPDRTVASLTRDNLTVYSIDNTHQFMELELQSAVYLWQWFLNLFLNKAGAAYCLDIDITTLGLTSFWPTS
jgi:hypothetical protein